MLTIKWSSKFKRDLKLAGKRRKDIQKFKELHEMLVRGNRLPMKYKDHLLTGNWGGCRECHIEPDWLLIYRVNLSENELEFIRMGTHADLFD